MNVTSAQPAVSGKLIYDSDTEYLKVLSVCLMDLQVSSNNTSLVQTCHARLELKRTHTAVLFNWRDEIQ